MVFKLRIILYYLTCMPSTLPSPFVKKDLPTEPINPAKAQLIIMCRTGDHSTEKRSNPSLETMPYKPTITAATTALTAPFKTSLLFRENNFDNSIYFCAWVKSTVQAVTKLGLKLLHPSVSLPEHWFKPYRSI